MLPDILVGRGALVPCEAAPSARPDHLAAETKPAIDRAGMHELQQHPVRIAVDDTLDRTEGVIADWIRALMRLRCEFGRIRDELARDRIVRIIAINQFRYRRRDSDGIARRHLLQRRRLRRRYKTGVSQLRNATQGVGHHPLSFKLAASK